MIDRTGPFDGNPSRLPALENKDSIESILGSLKGKARENFQSKYEELVAWAKGLPPEKQTQALAEIPSLLKQMIKRAKNNADWEAYMQERKQRFQEEILKDAEKRRLQDASKALENSEKRELVQRAYLRLKDFALKSP